MSFTFESNDDEYEDEGRSSTVTMAQLIATNKIMMQLVDELTERHETARKLTSAAVKFLHPDHPTRTLLVAIVRLLDKDLHTYLWEMGESDD
jgi:cysteine sulfinate desulfinase/cysteine desulfurase-like protein